jgi:hypothetical protein
LAWSSHASRAFWSAPAPLSWPYISARERHAPLGVILHQRTGRKPNTSTWRLWRER